MAVAIQASSSATTTTGAATVTCNKPTGTVSGDLLIAVIALSANGSNPVSSSGWTYVNTTLKSGSFVGAAVLWKLAGGSEPSSYTFTSAYSGEKYAIAILRLDGVDQTTPINAASIQAGSTSSPAVLESVTTTVANCMVLGLVGVAYSGSATVTSSDLTIDFYNVDNGLTSLDHRQVAVGHTLQASTGASGTKSLTLSPANYWKAYTLAIAPAAGVTDHPLTAGSGSYALTGTAATVKTARVVTAGAGAYALTGTAATLKKGYQLTAAAGSYALTGSTASLLAKRLLSAAAGSYALTGSAATLKAGRKLAAGAGSFALSGSTASVLLKRVLSAGAGSFALTGTDATLSKSSNKIVAAGSGSYAITGTDATFLRTWRVAADSGAFALTGTDAGLTAGLPRSPQRGDDAPPRSSNGRLPLVYFEHPKAKAKAKAKAVEHPAPPKRLTRKILRKAIAALPQGNPLWTPQAVAAALPPVMTMKLRTVSGPTDAQLAVMIRDWLVAKEDEADIEMLLLAA